MHPTVGSGFGTSVAAKLPGSDPFASCLDSRQPAFPSLASSQSASAPLSEASFGWRLSYGGGFTDIFSFSAQIALQSVFVFPLHYIQIKKPKLSGEDELLCAHAQI